MAQLPTAKTTVTTVGREGTPPGSNVASPFAQYYSADNTRIEAAQGEVGGIYVIASGYDGSNFQELLVSSAGRVHTISGPTITTVNSSQTSNLAAGATENTDISPGAGFIGIVDSIGFYCIAPDTWADGAAGSGTHQVAVKRTTGAGIVTSDIAILRAPYTEALIVQGNTLMNETFVVDAGGTTEIGAPAGIKANMIRGMTFDATNQLRLAYTNNTNVAMGPTSDKDRFYTVVYRKEYVG